MTLHGDVQVNGRSIGIHWEAQRISLRADDQSRHVYACRVISEGGTCNLSVQHNPDDGALALAAAVLSRAAEVVR